MIRYPYACIPLATLPRYSPWQPDSVPLYVPALQVTVPEAVPLYPDGQL